MKKKVGDVHILIKNFWYWRNERAFLRKKQEIYIFGMLLETGKVWQIALKKTAHFILYVHVLIWMLFHRNMLQLVFWTTTNQVRQKVWPYSRISFFCEKKKWVFRCWFGSGSKTGCPQNTHESFSPPGLRSSSIFHGLFGVVFYLTSRVLCVRFRKISNIQLF